MKTDIILSGVGGQGILSIAAVCGMAALLNDYHMKQAETHGMSQRGGEVQSHLRISDKPIASDLIQKGKADMILSVEPLEALRYLPYLKPGGWIITNSVPFKNIPNYPDLEQIFEEIQKIKNHKIINADLIAKGIGNVKMSNIVMLGAASNSIEIPYAALQEGLKGIFSKKGEDVVLMNLKALEAGRHA